MINNGKTIELFPLPGKVGRACFLKTKDCDFAIAAASDTASRSVYIYVSGHSNERASQALHDKIVKKLQGTGAKVESKIKDSKLKDFLESDAHQGCRPYHPLCRIETPPGVNNDFFREGTLYPFLLQGAEVLAPRGGGHPILSRVRADRTGIQNAVENAFRDQGHDPEQHPTLIEGIVKGVMTELGMAWRNGYQQEEANGVTPGGIRR